MLLFGGDVDVINELRFRNRSRQLDEFLRGDYRSMSEELRKAFPKTQGIQERYVPLVQRFAHEQSSALYARPVVREEYSPGAGANVADNLQALGVGQVVVLSVLGDDWREVILRREMVKRGIIVDQLIVSRQRSTTTFIKPVLMGYDSQQEDARVDFENAEPLPPELEAALIDRIASRLPGLDAILVADQLDVNGVITDGVREALNQLAADHPDRIFVADSRQRIGLFHNMVLKVRNVHVIEAQVQLERRWVIFSGGGLVDLIAALFGFIRWNRR